MPISSPRRSICTLLMSRRVSKALLTTCQRMVVQRFLQMTELQDIFAQYGESYRLNHRLLSNQLKVMRAIEVCRTSSLGGHVDACDECGFMRISYNSCRNRHCPKCQTLN